VRDVLKLDDHVFTLKLTPNLAHALSVYGVARELSALTGAPLIEPRFEPVRPVNDAKLQVKVSAPDLCGRFSGRVIRNVNTRAKTPQWMVERLAGCGQRSVTALVDISNYVMFEFGRPSHIFDLDKIHGALDVRWGRKGEQLKLLNGATIEVDEKVGVIADDAQVESLAGIMGGDATAVSDDTKHVYVEAAFWWPESVQGRSRRFNFSTDAGHRFERGVDPEQTVEHIEHITRLIQDICGGEAGPMDDQVAKLPGAQAGAVARRAGSQGHRHARHGAAVRGCVCAPAPPGALRQRRHHGHAAALPFRPVDRRGPDRRSGAGDRLRPVAHHSAAGSHHRQAAAGKRRSRFAVRRLLAALGYQETINFSFVEDHWEKQLAGNPDPIRLLNPIASQMGVMRSSLLGSLLQVLKFNLDRKAERVRVFELGRVFLRDDSVQTTDTTVRGVRQPMKVAGLSYGSADGLQWGRKAAAVDFYDAKGDVQALLAPLRPSSHRQPSRDASWPVCGGPRRRQGRRLRGRTASTLAPAMGAAADPLAVRAGPGHRHRPASACLRSRSALPAGGAGHRGDRGRKGHA
jgi:phenylalanyl-tRNA synthetase beta chain